MTLREAIETKLPLKRPGNKSWMTIKINDYPNFSAFDVLADDWIVKREPIVFECRWIFDTDSKHIVPVGYAEGVKSLIDKKTRVTVEVIE